MNVSPGRGGDDRTDMTRSNAHAPLQNCLTKSYGQKWNVTTDIGCE